MSRDGEGRPSSLPWISWGLTVLAAYGLKRYYSRASAEDLAGVLAPTARAVGALRDETLIFVPEAGWAAPDGSYVIAPACAGMNFLILAFTLSALGFSHRLSSPGRRLAWGLGSLLGAWAATIAVNGLRIAAAVALYRSGPPPGLTPEQAHRLLGAVIYVGALWALFSMLDGLTAPGHARSPYAAVLVAGLYLGMTVVTPLLNGAPGRQPGYAGHAMMVTLVTVTALGLWFLARRLAAMRTRRQEKS
jgi:exosortase K